jgi:hypothetical protein
MNDFNQAIAEYGFTPDIVKSISENTSDLVVMPSGLYKFIVGNSKIEGHGILCVADIREGEIIGPARINGKRTDLGRFTNHDKFPNAKMDMVNSDLINLVSIGNISEGEEITIDYRQALSLQRQPVKREHIFEIEKEMFKFPQIEIPVRHYFTPGIYAREITVPADALITGVIHKYPQINILSKGTIRVSIDEEIREISAPYTVISAAGIKRIAYAVTECVWTTIVHTFKTDVAKIEKEFFAYTEQEYQDFVREKQCQA